MSDYKTLMASTLRAYPTLHQEPLDVVVEMLTNNGNYRWGKNGQIEPAYEDERVSANKMNYSDLDEDDADLVENMERDKNLDCLDDLYASRVLRSKVERQRRMLLDENMDTVVNGKCTDSYFRQEYHLAKSDRDLIQGKTTTNEDTRFLYFPDNMDPQWGEVVQDFHNWLLLRMNLEFGVAASGKTEHWPDEALLLRQKVELAQKRLHPILNNGEHYEVFTDRIQGIASRLIDEMMAEDEAENATGVATTTKPRRPGR